jgi:hypothetical protein
MVMEYVLSDTRKFWSIQSGTGSQAEQYSMLCVLAESVIRHKDNAVKYMVEEYGYTLAEALANID